MTQAYPLQWPKGRPRTKARSKSAFKVTPSRAFEEMMQELARFRVDNVVVSCNIPMRDDGTPYRDGLSRVIADPGVAVYFTRNKLQVCLQCDTYLRPWENCRAIGLAVEAFRSMERHGAHQVLHQAFQGFAALPSPDSVAEAPKKAWWTVLGVPSNATKTEVEVAWKAKCREAGGATHELNAAKDAGLAA